MKFLFSLFTALLLLCSCGHDEPATREQTVEGFPLITENSGLDFGKLYWHVPMLPRNIHSESHLRYYETIDSYGKDYLQTRFVLLGDTVYVHRKEMEEFGRHYKKTIYLNLFPRPILWGVKSIHVTAHDANGSMQNADEQVILHIPPFKRDEKAITYAGKTGYHLIGGFRKSNTDSRPLSVVNQSPDLFCRLSPSVTLHVPTQLWKSFARFTVEVTLENGTRLSTQLYEL